MSPNLRRVLIGIAALLLLVLPMFFRTAVWQYNHRDYEPGDVGTLNMAATPVPTATPIARDANVSLQSQELRPGPVVVDLAHGNRLDRAAFEPLAAALAERGVGMRFWLSQVDLLSLTSYYDFPDQSSHLRPLLDDASALIVISPFFLWSPQEIALVERFVARGGRLLLISDPEVLGDLAQDINNLAEPFGLVFNDDYLYNTVENDGNFVHIYQDEYLNQAAPLEGSTIAFYGARSLGGDGIPQIRTGENVLSSLRTGVIGFDTVVIGGSEAKGTAGRVLAMTDFDVLTQPYVVRHDNPRLLGFVADFLATGDMRQAVIDFPAFLGKEVTLVFGNTGASNGAVDASVLIQGARLQQSLEATGRTLTLAGTGALTETLLAHMTASDTATPDDEEVDGDMDGESGDAADDTPAVSTAETDTSEMATPVAGSLPASRDWLVLADFELAAETPLLADLGFELVEVLPTVTPTSTDTLTDTLPSTVTTEITATATVTATAVPTVPAPEDDPDADDTGADDTGADDAGAEDTDTDDPEADDTENQSAPGLPLQLQADVTPTPAGAPEPEATGTPTATSTITATTTVTPSAPLTATVTPTAGITATTPSTGTQSVTATPTPTATPEPESTFYLERSDGLRLLASQTILIAQRELPDGSRLVVVLGHDATGIRAGVDRLLNRDYGGCITGDALVVCSFAEGRAPTPPTPAEITPGETAPATPTPPGPPPTVPDPMSTPVPTPATPQGPTAQIMIVDDNANAVEGESSEADLYLQALAAAGYPPDLWPTADRGVPTIAQLQEYKWVIWSAGGYAGGGPNLMALDSLLAYINQGGRLTISSREPFFGMGAEDASPIVDVVVDTDIPQLIVGLPSEPFNLQTDLPAVIPLEVNNNENGPRVALRRGPNSPSADAPLLFMVDDTDEAESTGARLMIVGMSLTWFTDNHGITLATNMVPVMLDD